MTHAPGQTILAAPVRAQRVGSGTPDNSGAPDSERSGRSGVGGASVLDACCGSRMFWFDRADARAVFVDKRRETHELPDISSAGASVGASNREGGEGGGGGGSETIHRHSESGNGKALRPAVEGGSDGR